MRTTNNFQGNHKAGLVRSFLTPCVDSYQAQKRVRVMSCSSKHNFDKVQSEQISLDFTESSINNDFRTEKWNAFIQLRLESALNHSAQDNNPSIPFFPGHTVPGPGGKSCQELYRGSLMFVQFVNLFDFDGGIPDFTSQINSLDLPQKPAPLADFWPWAHVKRPELAFVDMESITSIELEDSLKAINSASRQNRIDNCLAQLQERCESLLVNPESSMTDLLLEIHRAWSNAREIQYTAQAVHKAEHLLQEISHKINKNNLLAVLFELEAITSYMTYAEHDKIFASGVFAGNWLEVGLSSIGSIAATEFCVRDRLLDEIINLTSQRFAPIVLNEFGSVSDGNHRLTACWMWNLLKFTSNCNWSLEDDNFQEKVGNFVNSFEQDMGPVSSHEVLSHLAYFLSNPESRARLNNQIKRLVSRQGFIWEVPTVLLPEYSSSTVVKSVYDDGQAVVRVAPSVYYAMKLNQALVLPPRASYHFTDSALLPWFSVLRSAANKNQLMQII